VAWPRSGTYGTALGLTDDTTEPVPSAKVPRAISVVAAAVPFVLAALVDPGAPRESLLGLTLGADRGGAPPIAQIVVPALTLLPIGAVEVRAAIALAIPAAIATFLLTRRASRRPFSGGGFAPSAIVLAFGAIAGALLSSVPPSGALVVVALDLAIEAHVAPPSRRSRSIGLALGIAGLAMWASPRLAPAVLLASVSAARSAPFRSVMRRACGVALPLGIACAIVLLARDASAWLVLGRPLDDGVLARGTGPLFASAVALRTAIVAIVLTLGTIFVGGWRDSLDPDDRAAVVGAIAAILCGVVLHAPGAGHVGVVLLLPLAASTASAMHIAVDRQVGERRRPVQRVIAWLVPALALGLAARAMEDDLRMRRRSADAAAAVDYASIATLGTTLPRGVLVIEDRRALVSWARDRVVLGLRPDTAVLPVQSLLVGGPGRMATRTLETIPKAADLVRGLLAHGTLEEADASPLAQQATLLVDLPASRVRLLARHADPTGGPLRISVERVDPSERRARRAALDRRLKFVVDALASEMVDDPVRAALRTSATREARALSSAGDREGAMAALARSLALGADAQRIARWMARVRAKQTLEIEPVCEDD